MLLQLKLFNSQLPPPAVSAGRDINGFVWTTSQLHLRTFVRTINWFFSQVKSGIFEAGAFDPQHWAISWEKDARMQNLSDFIGKDMALPLPSFGGAALDAL